MWLIVGENERAWLLLDLFSHLLAYEFRVFVF